MHRKLAPDISSASVPIKHQRGQVLLNPLKQFALVFLVSGLNSVCLASGIPNTAQSPLVLYHQLVQCGGSNIEEEGDALLEMADLEVFCVAYFTIAMGQQAFMNTLTRR